MAMCPAGHQTNQSDFCDVCGLPVNAPAPVAATPTITCPNCATANVPDALFCESCGYDFATGAMPGPAATPQWPLAATPEGSEPSVPPTPAALSPASAGEAPPDASTTPDAVASASFDAAVHPPVAEDAPPEALPSPVSDVPAAPAERAPRPSVEWVAELWIDPDWYANQGSTDPMPSVGLPDIVGLVKPTNLIGRVSHSRGIFPDIDCDLDSGCSRRHAMLTHDGARWWIEDLGSANGTFVGLPAGPLPAMPIPQGRVELSDGQRIYVGAWTRIVIRPATDDEREAFGN